MTPELGELIDSYKYEDREWGDIIEKLGVDRLVATGGVEWVPSLKVDLSPRVELDDDGEPILNDGKPILVYDLKPILRRAAVTISFWDLQGGLQKLSPRKREAVFYNVILDKKQKDVAEIMGITTVSVGQYVDQAMLQLSEDYFAQLEVIVDEDAGIASGVAA
jgi:DNA-directed RNA polymerase specialized sigma24 family protein